MIILHGENQVPSRQQLLEVKHQAVKAGKQLVELEGDSSMDQIRAVVESNSLFGSSNLVIIENLFSSRPSNLKKAVGEYLLRHTEAEIVIWEGKDVSTKIKDFDPRLVRRFDLPKYVFKFLEDLSLTNLQLSLHTAAPEQILALLASHLHKLILVKEGVANLPSWQLGKLKYQVTKFSVQQLQDLIAQLLDIDYAQKTSSLAYDLATALEIFVIRLQ